MFNNNFPPNFLFKIGKIGLKKSFTSLQFTSFLIGWLQRD